MSAETAIGQPVVFAQPAPDAVVEEPSTSDGRVRCAKSQKKVGWRCKRMFIPKMTVHGKLQKWCPHCQQVQQKGVVKYRKTDKGKKMLSARMKVYHASEKGKATLARASEKWQSSEKGKAYRKAFIDSGKQKACVKRYLESEKGKATRKKYKSSTRGKEAEKRYRNGEKALARRRKWCVKMRKQIAQRIGDMCRDKDVESISALQATGCASSKELRAHFESTFKPWMNWSNRGMHKTGGNSGTWQTGHRLACAFYNPSNPADIKRCWNKANLFAQDSDENHALSVKMPDDAVLEELRSKNLLPCLWKGEIPSKYMRQKMEEYAALPHNRR